MTKIIIKKVSKTIEKNQVLTDISLVLTSGEIYGLQGINGSGKTMLMRAIIGLIRPTSGEIWVDDKQLGEDLDFPESVGFLIENPVFLNRYSGFQNLKMLAVIQKEVTDDLIWQTLRAVGLDEYASRKKFRKYSLGMKQRLGLAAALIGHKDIIMMDEPTNALDASGVMMIKELLLAEKKRGALIIVACHDLTILHELADKIIQLDRGQIIEQFTVKDSGGEGLLVKKNNHSQR